MPLSCCTQPLTMCKIHKHTHTKCLQLWHARQDPGLDLLLFLSLHSIALPVIYGMVIAKKNELTSKIILKKMNAQLCSITIVFIELCLFIPFTITLKVTCLYCLQTNSNGQRLFADQIFTLLMLFVHQCFSSCNQTCMANMIRNMTGPSAHSLWCSRSHLQECLRSWSYRCWSWWWYKILVKFAAERDGWKKQRLERYARWETSAGPSCKKVCDISFGLAGQLSVGVLWFSWTPKMWWLKLCIDLNSTFVSDCVEDGLVKLFRVLGHRNITMVQSMPRILRLLRLLEHFYVNCSGISATMKFRIF